MEGFWTDMRIYRGNKNKTNKQSQKYPSKNWGKVTKPIKVDDFIKEKWHIIKG